MLNIYLLRHFKVKDKRLTKLNSKAFNQWVKDYDSYDLEYLDIDVPKIDKTFVSSQNRAIKTAQYLKQNFVIVDDLFEVKIKAFISIKFKFPKLFWLIIGRVLWYFNVSQSEKRVDTIQRAKQLIERIENEESQNILLISHGLFLKILQKELIKNGYRGEIDLRPKNGVIYRSYK